ncbi:DUF1176 domain-containing protein [Sphingobium sufflavum]|uniref:DUF1176 domain-containing protein n=1 Tax=Sphingobium sufflavum TaxID=1129547 RepID=UPI001F2D189F|nr:DUF1176 domain-containing protein [Sphingobium sufflavum]MCE7797584.1 DUF1176 domain-containing protein [Sphingobium sufflavum]
MTRGVLTTMARAWAATILLATGQAPSVSASATVRARPVSTAAPAGAGTAARAPSARVLSTPALSGGVTPRTAAPQPGLLQYNGDWAVGCDNLLQCEAIALQPDVGGSGGAGGDDSEPILVRIVRAGGPGGDVMLGVTALSTLPPEIALVADGQEVARLSSRSDEALIRGDAALRAVQAMAAAATLEVRAAGRRNRGQPRLLSLSSAGLADSLRFVDTRQGRTGTAMAFVARGVAPETAVPARPAMPVVQQVPSPDADAAPGLNAMELAVARRLAVCDASLMADGAVELFPLDADAALLLLPCEAGAYNVSAVPLIARGAAGGRTLSVARFDFAPGFTGEPGKPPLVVNALWDARRGILSSLAKGRGVGDCGASENYVWDGTLFRLIESRAMHVCRGAWEWIRLWEAEPQRAPLVPVAAVVAPR